MIKLGLLDSIETEGGSRVIRVKFTGKVHVPGYGMTDYWSSFYSGNTLTNPAGIVASVLPATNTDCFDFQSIDLGAVC